MAQPLKVTCPSCSAKFHIPLHLVRGKVVSFRCKKCKGTIPVDGRAISTATPQPLPAPNVTPPEGWVPPARQSSPPPDPLATRTPHYSEPPMRLSLSDGLVVHGGMPSTTGLQVDTPSAFTHSNAPSQRIPGASRTPPWGLGAPSTVSAPPPAISRTDPPEDILGSDPPPSFRPAGRGKKIVGGIALLAAAGFTLWAVGMREPPNGAAASGAAPVTERPTPAHEQPAEPKAAAEHAPPAAAPVVTTEPARATPVAALPPAKDEAALTKPARASKGRAPKAAPAPADSPAEVAPAAEEPASPAPLTASAAAAQEATNAAAQDIEFNKEAARHALEDAGQRAASCRTIDAPAGAARVAVTFAPAGNVTAAVIESGPFVGTAAGGCVASKFRAVRVPAFTGDPVTVHKSISF